MGKYKQQCCGVNSVTMFTARKTICLLRQNTFTDLLIDLNLHFSLCFEIKANVGFEYSFHDKTTQLILGQMSFILQRWEGLRTSPVGKYRISALFTSLPIHLGLFALIFFFQQP